MSEARSFGRELLLAPGRTVLVAPDKFKGSVTARVVADTIARRLAQTGASIIVCPIADGGDGTVAALLSAGYDPVEIETVGALGAPTVTTVAVRDGTAVVELADVCGLAGLTRPDALETGTLGLGVVLRRLFSRGFTEVAVGLGGSASTDGGLGMLLGLGARAVDAAGDDVPPSGAGLLEVAHLETADLEIPPDLVLRIACDVNVGLAGPQGAAVLFGPQKGATQPVVEALDTALVHWGGILATTFGRDVADIPGAGAAGGTGAALLALGGRVIAGADALLTAVEFDEALSRADLVVTGEGRWDDSSLRGKGPGEVVRRSVTRGVPVALVVGQVGEDVTVPDGVFAVAALSEVVGSAEAAITDPIRAIDEAAAALVRRVARCRSG